MASEKYGLPHTSNLPAISEADPPKHTVHWFRRGLRLHDNPALREGIEGATTFRCVFVIDPWFASCSNVGINKWRFLLDCLADLDSNLRKLKSRLFVVRGQPIDVLPRLFREWGTTVISFEEDPEPFGRVRDYNIARKCREIGMKVIKLVSHTLYTLDDIIERNGGKAPMTYHQFLALVADMPLPLQPEEAINLRILNGATTPISPDHDNHFGVPTLEELGFDTDGLKPATWVGGETEALSRLNRYLERKEWTTPTVQPKVPQSLMANSTELSPYFRFGCLSPRLFYYQLTDRYTKVKKSHPPIVLYEKILWREFFYCAATNNPCFDRMEDNPICIQIPWDINPTALAKWGNGQTGFPLIDAIMCQLREEGWAHHIARHAVACFLTRGDLWISWEQGMKVFDELVLDADWSLNAGMWMWWSCSSAFQQFFHCYCPVDFGRKLDPNGEYIRRYVPALRHMPTRYIHSPWTAPEAVQRAARCTVGHDYPQPMLDHSRVAPLNIARMKQVYAQLAKYKPQGSSQILFQELKIENLTPDSSICINQSTMLQSNDNMCENKMNMDDEKMPTEQDTKVSQENVNNSGNLPCTNTLGNDTMMQSEQTKNTLCNLQSNKAEHNFKNLAIASKASEYARTMSQETNSISSNKDCCRSDEHKSPPEDDKG